MMKLSVALAAVLLAAGLASAADISVFTAPYANAQGSITFTEKLTPSNAQAAVTVTIPEVAYTTGEGTAQYQNGSWTGAAGTLTADQGIIRLLGFDPAWAALPGGAVKREGNTVTVTAGGGTYTVKLDGSGRVAATATPQRSFRYFYSTALPVASRVEIRQADRVPGQALRTAITGGAPPSGSGLSGLGSLLGFGGSSQSHSVSTTAGSRGLGDTGDGSGAAAFSDGGAALNLSESGLPAFVVSEEELQKFLTEGGLHLPASPVVPE